jgi:hypothetical protein
MRKFTNFKVYLASIKRMNSNKFNFMKATNLLTLALCLALLAASGLIGCEDLDSYPIDSPSDLQHKIDSIADAKAGIDRGDTTYIDINTAVVGAEDNSAGWWSAFSDYFTIPTNKLLHLEFINHGTGVNNWNNWNLAVSNLPNRDTVGYAEYFVLRSDAFGWGNGDFNLNLVSNDYPDTDGDGDIWNDFRTTMQGARVTLEIDHSATGNVFITATAVGTNGTKLTMTYNQPVSATSNISAFLICDGSHFEMKKAYLLPSKITVVEDVNPTSITIAGAPSFVEIGDENFWGDAKATVTYSDGSSAEVDSADISFTVVPDMTTIGKKTVIVAYSKTKKGAYGPAISTLYNLEVSNSVASLEVTTLPKITTYYYFASDSIIFNTSGIVVTATYSDNTTAVLPNTSLKFGKIPAATGAQVAKISYVGARNTTTTTCPLTLVKGLSQVGLTNMTTGWWTSFSDDFTVASGASKTFTMYCYSNEINNWHSPCTILRKADKTENAVVRMDSFGWASGYAAATVTNDWNWDIFKTNISGSKVVIKVTNNGDNTADVLYNVTYATGETHFQKYAGITIESSDLTCALVLEGSYLVITE